MSKYLSTYFLTYRHPFEAHVLRATGQQGTDRSAVPEATAIRATVSAAGLACKLRLTNTLGSQRAL